MSFAFTIIKHNQSHTLYDYLKSILFILSVLEKLRNSESEVEEDLQDYKQEQENTATIQEVDLHFMYILVK